MHFINRLREKHSCRSTAVCSVDVMLRLIKKCGGVTRTTHVFFQIMSFLYQYTHLACLTYLFVCLGALTCIVRSYIPQPFTTTHIINS